MMTRHQMRESVFLLTFERIFNGDPLDSIIETARECETVEIDDRVLAWVTGIDEKKTEIDQEIEKHLKKNWTLTRISKVSLAVLRVAVYELLFVDDMETNVSISEAVKIAQEYTTKEDVSFVNGVLSSAAKSLA
ncbi:MAG: transcription antitermination factor NusB [Oscillospiraceae bacterium]|nr:transcription antitermination factor NusB [Oscillospiraceae bacterium]MDY3065854.1 transcription antitermination factor NusB [Oscillospiraceae bacterium]